MAATVTVYANPQAQSQELPAPPVDRLAYRSLGASGDGLSRLGSALQSAGGAEQEIALDQLATINEASVKDAHAQLISRVNDTLNNPDSGYLRQLGKNAVDGFGGAKKAIASAIEDTSSTLTNPAQQRLFKQAATATAQSALSQAQNHAGQQVQKYAFDSSVTRATAAADMAVRSYNPVDGADNTAYATNLRAQAVELDEQAGRLGITGDERVEYIKKGLSKTYVETVNHLVSNNQVKGAQSYFKSVQDLLPVDVRDHVNNLLKAGQDKEDSLSVALATQKQGGTLRQMETRLNEQFSAGAIRAEVRDMALQRLRADDTQRRSELAETDKAVLGDVWAMAAKRPGMTVADLPAATIAYARSRGLGPHIDAILKADDPKEAKIDDSQQFNDWSKLSSTDQSAFLRAVDSGDLVTQRQTGMISKATFQHFTNLASALNRGDIKKMDEVRMVEDTIKSIKAPLLSSGLLGAKPGTDKAKRYESFEAELRQALIAEQQANPGKPVKPERMREIGQGMLKDRALSGTGIFGTSLGQTRKPVFEMTPAERAAPWEIPPADRAQVIEALKAQGKPVDEATIQRRYKFVNGVRE